MKKTKMIKRFISIMMLALTLCSTFLSVGTTASAAGSNVITVVLNDNQDKKACTTARLNLRTSASTKARVKTVLPKGMVVSIKKTSGKWCFVEAYPQGDKYTGWVSKAYLDEWFPVGGTFQVEAEWGINVRAKASTRGSKLGALKYKAKVEAYGQCGDWTMIKYKGKTGYIATKYLRYVD